MGFWEKAAKGAQKAGTAYNSYMSTARETKIGAQSLTDQQLIRKYKSSVGAEQLGYYMEGHRRVMERKNNS